MGHGQKNANRGAAINRNAARNQKLAEKIGECSNDIGAVRKELKDKFDVLEIELADVKGMIVLKSDEFAEFLNMDYFERNEEIDARLEALERSIWRKTMDKIKDKTKDKTKDKKRAGDPASPNHRAVFGDRSAVRPLDKNEDKKGGDDGEDEHSDD